MVTVTHRRRWRLAVVGLFTVVLVVPTIQRSEAAVACGPTAGVIGGDWRSYGHDLANTRTQDKEFTIGITDVLSLEMLWSHQGTTYNVTPIIADGCAYLADASGVVSAHNADTGEQLWSTALDTSPAGFGGGIAGTPAVDGNRLLVIVNRQGSPYLQALDRSTGAPLWSLVLDTQELAMSNSSPVAFNGMVFAGFSGSAGPGLPERGGYVIVDSATGAQRVKQFVIDDASFASGFAGAGVWSTPAVDLATGYAYVGTSNPHSPQLEYELANSIIKIDVDPSRSSFGTIVDHYKGLPDTYYPGLADQPVCDTFPDTFYVDRFSASCIQIDLDFGASPTLFQADGRALIGGLQKAGVFHVVDPATMDGVWQQVVGVPGLACNAGSPASANGSVYTAGGPPAALFNLAGRDSGLPQWTSPLEGVTSYSPVTVANGIVYVTDNGGFLNAFDARNGLPLLKRNVALDTGRSMINETSSGGVTVARNTIYVALADSVVAFRVGSGGGVPGLPPAPASPPPPGGDGGSPIIAGPGAVATTYATPTVTMQQGGSATFTNLDVPQHDVVGENGSFSTPLIGIGQSAPVAGVEALAPGVYGFYCSLHPNMTGTLQVTP